MRWGRKSTAIAPGLASGSRPASAATCASSCSISATWRWPPRPYAFTLSLTSPNIRSGFASRPAPETPLLASTTRSSIRPGARERREREERGGRVAAGRADDGDRRVDERLELGAVELGQPVDRDVEEVGVRVLEAVPARVVGRVAEAEVGPEVDDRGAGLDDARDDARGRAVGEGEEDGVDSGSEASTTQAGVGEVRVDAVERVAVAVAALEADDRHVRVAGQEADQLGADVAGRPDDADPDAPVGVGAAGRDHPALRSRDETRRAVRRALGRRLEPRAHGRSTRLLTGSWLEGVAEDRMDRRHGRMTIQVVA